MLSDNPKRIFCLKRKIGQLYDEIITDNLFQVIIEKLIDEYITNYANECVSMEIFYMEKLFLKMDDVLEVTIDGEKIDLDRKREVMPNIIIFEYNQSIKKINFNKITDSNTIFRYIIPRYYMLIYRRYITKRLEKVEYDNNIFSIFKKFQDMIINYTHVFFHRGDTACVLDSFLNEEIFELTKYINLLVDGVNLYRIDYTIYDIDKTESRFGSEIENILLYSHCKLQHKDKFLFTKEDNKCIISPKEELVIDDVKIYKKMEITFDFPKITNDKRYKNTKSARK